MTKNRNICTTPGCIFFGKYCRLHPTGSMPEQKPISPRSKKLDKVMRNDYVPQVKEMVEAGTMCELKTEVCTGRAQGFHHPYGKASEELLLTEKVPSCNPCNVFCEINDSFARQQGWKKSKFAIPSKNQKIQKYGN